MPGICLKLEILLMIASGHIHKRNIRNSKLAFADYRAQDASPNLIGMG